MKYIHEGFGSPRSARNDCTVRALCATTAFTYAEAEEILASHGRKKNRGFASSLLMSRKEPLHGHVFKKVVGYGIKQPSVKPGCWLQTFVQKFPKGRYYVCKRAHAFAVIDGAVVDLMRPSPRCRIKMAWEVTMP